MSYESLAAMLESKQSENVMPKVYRIIARSTGVAFDFWDVDCAMEFASAVLGLGNFSIQAVNTQLGSSDKPDHYALVLL